MVAIKTSVLLWATVATLTLAYPGQEQGWQGSGGDSMKHSGEYQGGNSGGSGHGGQEYGGGNQGGQGHGGRGYDGQGWKDNHGPQGGGAGQGQGMQDHGDHSRGNNKGNRARDEDFAHEHANLGDWVKQGFGHGDQGRTGGSDGKGNHPRDYHPSGHESQHEHGGEGLGHTGEHQGQGFGNGNHPRDFQPGEHGEQHNQHGQDHGDHGNHEHGFPHHLRTRATELGVYEMYDSNGSMGPDKGFTCAVYEQKDCNDKGWVTAPGWKYPGTPNYHTSQFLEDYGRLGNGIISIKCKKS
ncbi:hypothetical protein H2204_014666 [Knufia peltigerae]|uniref:Uncharacterized protein n=1 Tax=Knufia peltigerae TaxID=1002370 RepID=A0AA38XHW3_9EURO|nr:hypothetical protein H2204_014666 [Knufia peltigerae]